VSKFSARSTVIQCCPAKASKILRNEWHCPAYANTRVGKYAHYGSKPIIAIYSQAHLHD